VIAEPPAGVPLSHDGVVASEGSPAFPVAQTAVALPFRRAHILKPCALAAFVSLILMLVGLHHLVATLSAGFLAVVFYRQRLPAMEIKAALGARLGVLSGLCFAAVIALVAAIVGTFQSTNIREQILENATKWVASHPSNPQFQAALEQLKTPEGFATALVVACVLLLMVWLMLASLGGVLAATILGRRDKG
jgi:hypothetical protein